MRFEIVGILSDVRGSCVNLGFLEGFSPMDVIKEAKRIALNAQTEPELLEVWLCWEEDGKQRSLDVFNSGRFPVLTPRQDENDPRITHWDWPGR